MKALVTVPDGYIKSNFLCDEALKILEENFEVTYNTLGREFTQAELEEEAEGKDIIVTGWGTPSFIGTNVFNKKTSVKLIAHTGGSTGDLLDLDVYDKGVRVISGNRLFAESVAEGTIAYILMALRNLPDEVMHMRRGGWKEFGYLDSRGLLDTTIGIIGCGMISRYLMKMLKVFRVKIKIFSMYDIEQEFLDDVNAERASLEEIFSTCPIVSLHSALSDDTWGMIGKEHFDMMQDGAIFINTARANIVRQDEMIEALKEQRIRAVIDVYAPEPPAKDSPLRSLPNVYAISHKAGPTSDRFPYIGKCVVEDAVRFVKGEELQHEIPYELAKRMTRKGV